MNSLSAASMETDLILPIERTRRTDLYLFGGKAANLGELVRAGFPVPPGFVINTSAYDRFIAQNGLGETMARLNPGSGGTDIRAAFTSASIPLEVEQQILSAYRQLGQGAVAVRSSATAEDLPEAAFAGQQDTYLNITGTESLLDAVRRCWASLWTDRAIVYRERQGIDQGTVKLAVVVQRMVAADFAGVMFTANPVTGARDEVVIDASPGLGEAVVSGLVTPDHFVLKKRRLGWSIIEQRAGRREVIIRARSNGGTEHVKGKSGEMSESLPDEVLQRLACLGTAIGHHFGSLQDIEWAWGNGKLYILQSRPMTALPEPPPDANMVQRMLASNFTEMLPVRPYPLDMDVWMPALGSAVEPIFGILGLEWYFRELFRVEDGIVIEFVPKLPHPTWKIVLAPLRFLSLFLRYNPIKWQSDPLLAATLALARELDSLDPSALSWEQLLEMLQSAKKIPWLGAGELRRRYFPRAAFALVRLRLLLVLLGRKGQLGTLISGGENKTLEMNHALEKLANQIRSDPELMNIFAAHHPEDLWSALEDQASGRIFLTNLRTFFDLYGHRETTISTALHPTWKESPAMVLGILKSFAANRPQVQTGDPAWQAARDEILKHPLLRFSPLRSVFLNLLTEARTVLQIREDTHFYATLSMPLFRRALLELGSRLVNTGLLDTPEDIFHLKLNEIERIGGKLPPSADLTAELRASVIRRRKARALLEDRPLVDPRLLPQRISNGDTLLSGMPSSPGVAEGPVCIVQDASEFDKLTVGDVLVAPYTNPSWTPLFQRAAAVVVDSGSVASHAAIVAREYGIPAVMATGEGTGILRDGEKIRVDGSRGTVVRVTSTEVEREGQEKMIT